MTITFFILQDKPFIESLRIIIIVTFPEQDQSWPDPNATTPPSPPGKGKEVKGCTHTYYQVLIDGRDSPYITHRAQTEPVTFLGNQSENSRNLYAIPGLDYVAHEDVLPHSTEDGAPIQHELFDKFLMARYVLLDEKNKSPSYTLSQVFLVVT